VYSMSSRSETLPRERPCWGLAGGGDPYLGTLAAVEALRLNGPPMVIDLEELSDEGFVASLGMVGAPVPLVEKFSLGPELMVVYEALQQQFRHPLEALVPVEIGGGQHSGRPDPRLASGHSGCGRRLHGSRLSGG